jgi:[protein-PII] uridylyltransferase
MRSPLPSSVLIDNASSQECTVIEIRSTDRPGLLYRITRALSECQLNIQRAIITTEAYGVVDVFYVTDLEYNKIYDVGERKKIEQTILEAIAVEKKI